MAVFFFPKPPEVPSLEKSFRTLTSEDFAAIPRRVRFFLRQGQAMQLNLAEPNDGKTRLSVSASQRYIDLAFTRYYQHRFDQRQLAEYLNMKPKSLPTFAEKFAGGGL